MKNAYEHSGKSLRILNLILHMVESLKNRNWHLRCGIEENSYEKCL